jgi:uncharacterized protein with ParB-like and HNH nuclease domain
MESIVTSKALNEGIITSKDLSVGQLFESFYVIPNYQREFVWTDDEVKKLVDDIYAEFMSGGDQHQIEYFVGSMVVCPRSDGSYEVIDGQQRLTTFWIFFCALKEFFRANKFPIPQDLGPKIASIKINERGEEEAHFRIDLHYMEGQGILRIFSNPDEFKDLKIAKKSRSIDNLHTAYNTISEFLGETFSDRLDEVRKFYGYLCHRVKIIRVQTGTVSRALKIFETINDRGIGLDSMDLLKNLLFIKAKPEIFDQLRDSWQSFVDLLYDHKEKPLRFIRYYIYANFRTERLYEDEVYSWFEKEKSRCGIEENPLGFVASLHSAAYAYTKFLEGLNLDGSSNRFLENIRLLGGSSRQHLMLLLAARHLERANFAHFCEWTENLLCIYSLGRELGRAIEPKFARWTPEIRAIDAASSEDLDKFLQRRYLPEINNFRQRFMLAFEEMTDENIQKYKLRYVLGKVYQYVQYKAFKKSSDLDLSRFTEKGIEIEHVIPVSKDKGFKIQLAGSEVEYDRVIHQLGNLALIEKSINASISNKTLDKKQNGFRNSDFILTRHLAARVELGNTSVDKAFDGLPYFEEWSLRTLADRQSMFRDLALKTWGLDQMPDFSSVLTRPQPG